MKKTMTLFLSFLLIISLAACGSGGSGSSGGSGDTGNSANSGSSAVSGGPEESGDIIEITFALDWTPNTNHTGLYVAQAKGWFEDAGLKVSIVQPSEDSTELLVATNRAQFGVGFQDTLAPALTGDDALPVTAVAAILQHNTSGIISRADKGIERPSDMDGHTYATWDNPIELATLRQVVERDGGDFDSISLIPSNVTDEVTALSNDQVDTIWIFYGWAGVACEVAGLDTSYFAFSDIDPVFDYYTPVIIACDDFLNEHPEETKAFLDAVRKGYEYAVENPEDAAAILLEAVPELKSNEKLVIESQKYMAGQYKADAERWGYIDPSRWNAFYSWLNDNSLVESPLTENRGFSNDYLPE